MHGQCEKMPCLHGVLLGCAEQPPFQLFAHCKRDLTVLVQIAACWKDHCEQMLTIRSTFLYLDRTYVISTSGTRSLFEMGLQLYGQHLQEHPEVSQQHLSLAVHVWLLWTYPTLVPMSSASLTQPRCLKRASTCMGSIYRSNRGDAASVMIRN